MHMHTSVMRDAWTDTGVVGWLPLYCLHAYQGSSVLLEVGSAAPCLAMQGGAVKQYKGLECPLDGFQLVLFSLSGAVRQ